MKLVICWAEVSGYMSACWRALARAPGVELHVIPWASGRNGRAAQFADDVMAGIPGRLLDSHEREDKKLIASLVKEQAPDVLMIAGWCNPAYLSLVYDGAFGAKVLMGMDTPWRGDLRQRLARFGLMRLLRRLDGVMVPGERSWIYATRLGIPEHKIHRGLYGIDASGLGDAFARRQALPGGWPRQFLYMGRYMDVKAIDVLVDAYARYRGSVRDPWPLRTHGNGPLEHLLDGREGIENGGFIQPSQQPQMMSQSGVFVLASRFDPWPLVVVEACASGLPVVCTNACGSAVELVRSYYNGLMVPANDAAALCNAMVWMHNHPELLPEMGKRGMSMAQPYDASVWAVRMEALCRDLLS